MTGSVNDLAALTRRVTLRDGSALVVRAIRPDDRSRLERLFYRLSPETIYRRFFTLVTRADPDVIRYLVEVDYLSRLALVALIDDEIVAVARYDRVRTDPHVAEVAIVTEDRWQRRGIATILLHDLAAAATARGVTTFEATVLGDNRPIVRLLRRLSDDVDVRLVDGVYRVLVRLPGAAEGPG